MRDKFNTKSCSNAAFTLVELLVVVGVIALLIAMLLPALKRAQEQAQAVQCASNIHQIHLGLLMYANDYQGFLPELYGGYPDITIYPEGPSGPPAENAARGGWVTLLKINKYVSNDHEFNKHASTGVFACPKARNLGENTSGVMDGMLPAYRTDIGLNRFVTQSHPNNPEWWWYRRMKLSKFKTPTETYLLADSIDWRFIGAPRNGLQTIYELAPGYVHHRHMNLANICYVDGHVVAERDILNNDPGSWPPDHNAWLGWAN